MKLLILFFFSGKGLLERLVKHGIKCTYVLVNSVSFIMKEVTKVINEKLQK